MGTLGLAMIMQDEEAHIAPSLAQFYQVVSDLVVVDGGSSDQSVAWAKRMGARVFHRPFDFDFSAQKNFAIEQLQTDWVYVHDPDERLEPPLIEILPLLSSREGQSYLMDRNVIPPNPTGYDCFGVPRKNFIDGAPTEVYPDYQYRLFKSYCRYEKKVHEEITGFFSRTEIDWQRATLALTARFNILHYKSSSRQKEQNELYARLNQGVL